MRRPSPRSFVSLLLSLLAVGCIGPLDEPSSVHDLRVLGLQVSPPELMSPMPCTGGLNPAQLAAPVTFTALIADPKGAGRIIVYELRACADPTNDPTCSRAGESQQLALGETTVGEPGPDGYVNGGELTLTLPALGLTPLPGVSWPPAVPDGGIALGSANEVLLVQRVYDDDPFHGLGGLRMPLVLHLRAGTEEIYSQKLMVYSCQLFANQTAAKNPVLPGMDFQDAGWPDPAAGLFTVHGPGPFRVAAQDYAALEQPYVVPNVELQPIDLVESWKIDWYTDLGQFSTAETGGTDLGGQTGGAFSNWEPGQVRTGSQAHFWFVVRNGRGGESWLKRTASYAP